MGSAINEIMPAGLIVVMGGTGSGKSTFINAVVGKDVTGVSHDLESQTSEVKGYDIQLPCGLHATLVDTPGFNDYIGGKYDSELTILKEIGAFIKARHDEGCKLSGILYLHNINDPKVGSSLQRNMTTLKKLCGSDPLKNVAVVTTFWDEIDLTQGIENETELKTDKFFKGLVEQKSKFVRSGKYPPEELPGGPEFPLPISIVCDLLALDPVFVEMQKGLAEGKTMEEIHGAELFKEIQELKRQQRRDATDLNRKIAEMGSINSVATEALEDESRAMKTQMKEWEERLYQTEHSSRSELDSALAQLRLEKEASAKRDPESENVGRAELRSEMELLKAQHAKEMLEYQLQVQSLLHDNSIEALRKTQLEKTCEDLKATVSDLSQSLKVLRNTSERARIELELECNQLRANAATHRKTLDDLKSQLRAFQTTQHRTVTELSKVMASNFLILKRPSQYGFRVGGSRCTSGASSIGVECMPRALH